MVSRIACVGGGPAGLFFATLVKQADPSVEVTVFERNRAEDTFGFGVVFSDATLTAIHAADPVLLRGLRDHGQHWDEIEVRLKGERLRCGGNGMAAIHRKTLLQLLQQRAREVGVDVRFSAEVPDVDSLAGYELIVGADGANSMVRRSFADEFQPSVDVAVAKFIWFATTYLFDGLTFVHEHGPHGAFAVHGYPISDSLSTFIVETDEASWRAAGLDEFDTSQPPGPSDTRSQRYLESLFADQIDGHPLVANNSRWGNFRTLRTRSWHTGNVVILGDAAHTAHFSVGSGTKMALEDAVSLASAVLEHRDDVPAALKQFEDARRPRVERIQNSARPSLSWWENFGRYRDVFAPHQFAFHFLSRSIGRDKLAQRDPGFVDAVERDWKETHGFEPLATPLRLEGYTLSGRLATVRATPDGAAAWTPAGQEHGLALRRQRNDHPGPWGLWLAAPETENELAAVYDQLATALDEGPVLVAVHGGKALTRGLLAEQARLVHHMPVLVVEDGGDEDRARTLLLSGRADVVSLGIESGVSA